MIFQQVHVPSSVKYLQCLQMLYSYFLVCFYDWLQTKLSAALQAIAQQKDGKVHAQ